MEITMKEWKLLTKSFAFCIVFSVVAMTVMTVFFLRREEPANAEELLADGVMMEENGLFGEGEQENTEYICIPLPAECTEDRIQITEDLIGHKTMLTIQNIPENFFYYHPLSGSSGYVERPLYGYEDGTARICFELSGFYECERIFEEGKLYLRFLPPKEMYPRIVVLDAGHGGEDMGTVFYQVKEKDVALNIVLRAGKLLERAGVRVYYTRLKDTAVDTAERIYLADETGPDMFVSIHCNADAKTRVTRGIEILTDSSYRSLAECLAKELETVSESVRTGSGRGVPVLEAHDVPSVMVQAGYLTNKQEALQLTDERYLDKIALAIYNGIMKAYEEMEKEE